MIRDELYINTIEYIPPEDDVDTPEHQQQVEQSNEGTRAKTYIVGRGRHYGTGQFNKEKHQQTNTRMYREQSRTDNYCKVRYFYQQPKYKVKQGFVTPRQKNEARELTF